MANQSIVAAFERLWQHIIAILSGKADLEHSHEISDVEDLQTTLDEKTSVEIVRW